MGREGMGMGREAQMGSEGMGKWGGRGWDGKG